MKIRYFTQWRYLQIGSCFDPNQQKNGLFYRGRRLLRRKGTGHTKLRFKDTWLETIGKTFVLKNIHELDKTLLNSWHTSVRMVSCINKDGIIHKQMELLEQSIFDSNRAKKPTCKISISEAVKILAQLETNEWTSKQTK